MESQNITYCMKENVMTNEPVFLTFNHINNNIYA